MAPTRSFGMLIVSISPKTYAISIADYLTYLDSFLPVPTKINYVGYWVV